MKKDKYFKYNIFNYISCDYTTLNMTLMITTTVTKINVIKLIILKLTTFKDLLKDLFIINCKIEMLDIIALINTKCNKYNFVNTAVT